VRLKTTLRLSATAESSLPLRVELMCRHGLSGEIDLEGIGGRSTPTTLSWLVHCEFKDMFRLENSTKIGNVIYIHTQKRKQLSISCLSTISDRPKSIRYLPGLRISEI
jgi:hypothetical protein